MCDETIKAENSTEQHRNHKSECYNSKSTTRKTLFLSEV